MVSSKIERDLIESTGKSQHVEGGIGGKQSNGEGGGKNRKNESKASADLPAFLQSYITLA